MIANDLAIQLAQARVLYYRGRPSMDDATYDALEAKLKKIDPNNPLLKTVGAAPDPLLKKVKHRTPMGSLDNAFEAPDIESWVLRVQRATSGRVNWGVYQPKMDGLSVNLRYDRGVLVNAATRGDGSEGEDVTANVLRMRGIPRALPLPIDLDVRHEAMITDRVFDAHFKALGFSNARNAAAGTIRNKDTALVEHMRLYAFSADLYNNTDAEVNSLFTTEEKTIATLISWGFNTVTTERVEFTTPAITAAWERALENRANLPFGVDGLVVKVNSRRLAEECGMSATCPVGAKALKWRGQMVASTEIVGVEHSVGHTGTITPVAILKPVNCGGVMIARVSLMNWDEVARIEEASVENTGVMAGTLGNGAVVRIERAGDVIPRVIAVEKACPPKLAFKRPATCPCCSTATIVDGPRQRCPNPDCPKQTFRKVLNWVKGRDILFLGESTLDALMNPTAPYIDNIGDLYRLTSAKIAAACGSKPVADKIVAQIEQSRDCSIAQLLGNIGIPGIGESEAEKVVTSLRANCITDVTGASEDDFIAAIGDVKGKKLARGIAYYHDLIKDLGNTLRIVARQSKMVGAGTAGWRGKTFCITGATSVPRAQLIKMIEGAGGTWKGTVVNGLDYLITADPDSGSKKNKDAQAKNVIVISEVRAVKMADA